ncbi:LysR substrate-binding domain-containing protein [Rhizobiaceae bacterium n13]|uniref:LysR substrate-binding domain-containing protein n=1 Tax=Ferirhizobium litorale TaxID=2927786 RepID=A0AAE3QEH0_9HYPH|nr:LysR substrate-binding domain-containing protein [Fererhizobium litorale]MDI7863603.1 LysR substrate-binding domain-containing protein [Fererhizobium litorale]MDI7923476.1 LysR substrate-binding domain-containing protein [Fererhizobium litorale]
MNLPLESDLLRIFLAVADTRNITRAADKLGRTQSAVSMQVKRLEETAGTALFVRGPRGVDLTGEGKRLVPHARRIVDLVDETSAAIRVKPLDGPVRVGIPEEYSHTILPRALATFAERHPAAEVTVMCGYSSQQMAALDRDELDLAVIFDWDNSSPGEVLAVDPTVWVTSLAYACHMRRPVPIAVYWNSNWCRDFAIRSLEQYSIPFRTAYGCDTSGGLCTAVSAGFGIAPLARSNIPPGCRELTLEDGFPPVDSSRVVLKRNPYRSGATIEGLAEMLREAFRPLAPPEQNLR